MDQSVKHCKYINSKLHLGAIVTSSSATKPAKRSAIIAGQGRGKTLLGLFTLVEEVVDQVGKDDPLVAKVSRAGDCSELTAFLVVRKHIQCNFFFTAVHFIATTVFNVLNNGGGKEGDCPEHLRPAYKELLSI